MKNKCKYCKCLIPKKRKFCSHECYSNSLKKPPKKCLVCNNVFYPKDRKVKYCSKECRSSVRTRKKICTNCGKLFKIQLWQYKRSKSKMFYCSRDCFKHSVSVGDFKIENKNNLSHDQFLKKARQLHGDKYDYLTKYTKSKDTMKIYCKRCETEYTQVINNHLNGYGCFVCALKDRVKSHDKFIEEAYNIHGSRYEYLSQYTGYSEYIDIECNLCNYVFKQRSGNHLRGRGCPNCNCIGSYTEKYFERNPSKKKILSTLYLCELSSEEEKFLKVGITIKNNRYLSKDYICSIVHSFRIPLYEAFSIEQYILKSFEEYKYKPKFKFGGYTECLSFGMFSKDLFCEIVNNYLKGE